LAFLIKTGVPSTALKERTGLFTPPGIRRAATLYNRFDFLIFNAIIYLGWDTKETGIVNTEWENCQDTTICQSS
jgi:hypothetical protein